jgi:pSer/pThr/pTyr-binding forkhead associated (FHA) protein
VLIGFLVSYDGNELGRFWPISQGRVVVGRAQAAEGLDIAIDHGATSARHAQLIAAAAPSRLSVQDLGSTNGTFINDQRLASGHAQMLSHGDQIRFGGFTVRVVLVQ